MLAFRSAAMNHAKKAVWLPIGRCGNALLHIQQIPNATTRLLFPSDLCSCSFSTLSTNETINKSKEQTQPVINVRASLPEEYTSSNVMAVLNRKGDGGVPLEEDDMRILIDAAKTPKDSHVVMTSLIKYKRKNAFILTEEMTHFAVTRILAINPTHGPHIVLNNFNEKTGFSFSCSTPLMDKVLEQVLNRIQEYETYDVWSALLSTLHRLIYRASRPSRNMKKRAAKRYLKQLKCYQGPTSETVRLMVEIGLQITTAEAVHTDIVEYSQRNRVIVLEETLKVVEEARFKERMAALAEGTEMTESE